MDRSPPGVFGAVKGWRRRRASGAGVPAEPRVWRLGAADSGAELGRPGRRLEGSKTLRDPDPGGDSGGWERDVSPRGQGRGRV